MTAGIVWMILSISQFYLYKEKKLPIHKSIALGMLIPGTIMFIAGIGTWFIHSKILTALAVLPVVPAGFWIMYKAKEWHEAMDVMNKLTKK